MPDLTARRVAVRDIPGVWRQVAARAHPAGGTQVILAPVDADAFLHLASVSELHTLLRWTEDVTVMEPDDARS
jgi:hypothetical protein